MPTVDQRRRLLELADVLDVTPDAEIIIDGQRVIQYVVPAEPSDEPPAKRPSGLAGQVYFNMWTWHARWAYGTICCAVGLGEIIHSDIFNGSSGYSGFCRKAYGVEYGSLTFKNLFGSHWASADDPEDRTAKACAKRIRNYVAYWEGMGNEVL